MSDLNLIKGSFKKLCDNLPDILIKHMDIIDLAPERLSLRGKSLEDALKDQGAWPIVYASTKAELDAVCKYIDSEISRVRSVLVRQYVEEYSREISDRVREKYIDGDGEYLKYYHLYLEVKELYEKASAATDAFTTRGFALRDITLIRVNQLHTTAL